MNGLNNMHFIIIDVFDPHFFLIIFRVIILSFSFYHTKYEIEVKFEFIFNNNLSLFPKINTIFHKIVQLYSNHNSFYFLHYKDNFISINTNSVRILHFINSKKYFFQNPDLFLPKYSYKAI